MIRPEVIEAAVVGVPSDRWGQKVAAVIVLDKHRLRTGDQSLKPWGVLDVRRALKNRLANYKLPHVLKVLGEGIPRNAMGKGLSLS